VPLKWHTCGKKLACVRRRLPIRRMDRSDPPKMQKQLQDTSFKPQD
jgi:hypothetical protein